MTSLEGARSLAIVDITIIPIGTQNASVSPYVVEVHKTIQKFKEKVKYQLTPMSTILEGDLDDLLEVVKAIHEVPFQLGAERVATNIRIDDRRDKSLEMDAKVNSVVSKLNS
jgi:uncharacterized protein (TIGR00106 family)